MKLDRIEDAITAIAAGEIVVVVDDDDRENEGDLIMAAAAATPEKVAFMIRHTSGILCAPLTAANAQRLRLDPMVSANDAPLATAFTVSVDYRFGLTTGISAEERCNTVRALANDNAGSGDFVRPGHVFPLVAREGGVLMRTGHTEAAVDLARLAGLPQVGLLAELVNDDGTMQRGAQVADFARAHSLRIISVADIVAHRQRREQLVERIAEFAVQTRIGAARGIVYSTPFDDIHHLALVFGDISASPKDGVITRLHRENVVEDVFGRSAMLDIALDRIAAAGQGVLVYLREGGAGVPAMGWDQSSRTDTAPASAGEGAQSEAIRQEEWRDIGLGAQILRDLGLASIRLITNRERHFIALAGFGIKIATTDLVQD
ncbi:3,4-dihydroxy-2-butanone 4-phosphate synthase / GTP cyclohydrolase II [hydrothermal vent metagenome]|uniref:3,4-dihydroxy-2-butanone 4-phosphate synthase / GTP cyclohydrolase II n=1 Tax=hydrothermal vent metagenome TaxID=652676 RepID=A0A3B0SW93_9ZZZZ